MKSLENRLDKQSQAQFFSKSEILCMLKKDRAHQLKSAVGSVMPDLYRLVFISNLWQVSGIYKRR